MGRVHPLHIAVNEAHEVTKPTLEGIAGNQNPRQDTQSSAPTSQPRSDSPITLFTESKLRAALGGISVRKFKELRAAGVIVDPLALGPRSPRWTHDDYVEILRRLPRRPLKQEPTTLADGRRARIERMKAGAK